MGPYLPKLNLHDACKVPMFTQAPIQRRYYKHITGRLAVLCFVFSRTLRIEITNETNLGKS